MKIQSTSVLVLFLLSLLTVQVYGIQELKLDGHVVADQRIPIKNLSKEDLVIVRIANEGERVKKGDLLVEFDTAKLREKLSVATIDVNVAKAQVIKAESDLASAKLRLTSIQKKFESELALLEAESETLFSKNGKFAVEEETLESTIVVENARTVLLKKKMEVFEKENQKDNVNYLQLKFELTDSQAKSRVAMKSLTFMKEVARKQERRKLDIQRDNIKLQMIESVQTAESQLASVKSNIDAKHLTMEMATRSLKEIKSEIQKAVVRAPQDGVFHLVKNNKRVSGMTAEEGAIVRPNQTVAYLPNISSLCVDVLVPEARIKKLKLEQPAKLAADGDDVIYRGVIKSISSFPDSVAWVNSGKKHYRVLISVENPGKLKIGQSVSVTFAR